MAPSSRLARIRSRTVTDSVTDDAGRSSAKSFAFFAERSGLAELTPPLSAARALEPHSVLEENSFALDVCAAAYEKIAQFRRIVFAAVERIKPKENLAVRGEVLLQIAQKKIPIRCPPAFLRRMIKVEVGRKCGDPVEFLAKIGQWFESADSPNYARNTEKLEQFGEKSDMLDVQTQDGMTEVFGDEQKKSSAATKIENAFRFGTMELQILHAFPI